MARYGHYIVCSVIPSHCFYVLVKEGASMKWWFWFSLRHVLFTSRWKAMPVCCRFPHGTVCAGWVKQYVMAIVPPPPFSPKSCLHSRVARRRVRYDDIRSWTIQMFLSSVFTFYQLQLLGPYPKLFWFWPSPFDALVKKTWRTWREGNRVTTWG